MCTFVIRNSKRFSPQILKVVSPLGKKLIFFSPLGFEIQKNYDPESFTHSEPIYRTVNSNAELNTKLANHDKR